MKNYADALNQLREVGLILDRDRRGRPLQFDNQIQRWKVESGDNEWRGWTRLREWVSPYGNVYLVGSFGVWHGNDDGRQKLEMPKFDPAQDKEQTRAEQKAIIEANKAASKQAEQDRKHEARRAAAWAAQVWALAKPCTEHEYLTRKGIQPHGLRLLTSLDGLVLDGCDETNFWRLQQAIAEGHPALVVPMHDVNGSVNGIQFIYGRGHPRQKAGRDKDFWPTGMAMAGTFGLLGPMTRTGPLLVCEGFATAASLYQSTGQSCAYAFSANNLSKAGKLLRKAYPSLRLLFCADDDYLTDGNPGVAAASQATAEIELAAWVKPDFTDPETGADLRAGKKLTDFNDLAILTSALTLAKQINAALDAQKWRDASPSARGSSLGGGGEGSPPVKEGERPRARSVMSVDEIVERFEPIDDGTGKYVFDRWTRKVAHKDQMIALLPAGGRADDIKRHAVWQMRGAVYLDEIGFDPTEKDPAVRLNTWRGWPMQPQAGACQSLLDLLEYLCSGEANRDELFLWVLRWMAYPLQHPGAKMSSALIVHGPQGTGKSTVFQTLAKIYGDYATVLNQRGLEDKFNADWVDSKLFILAEEVVTRAEMWHIKNELKELITGEWVRVNPKNVAAYRQRNQVNAVFLSNEGQPLPLDNDDRRHCVIYTPEALPETIYDAVFQELDDGGVAAFYDYLLKLDLGDFHPKKRPPSTQAKLSLIALSKPSEYRFIDEWLDGQTGYPICPCLAGDLYAAYLKWCRANGESRPRPSNQFHGAVARLKGWQKKKARVYDNTHYSGDSIPRMLIIPPDTVLEPAKTTQPPDKTGTQWLTDSVFNFQQATPESEGGNRWAA